MSSHATQVIPQVAAYFGVDHPIPIVVAAFHAGRSRWERSGYNKRVSRSWLRKMKDWGYTHVQLQSGTRAADFSIKELLR